MGEKQIIKSIGITGTRRGANQLQLQKLRKLLTEYRRQGAWVFRHGDCRGVDVEAAAIARELGYFIVKHPGPHSEGSEADITFNIQPFLTRNKVIVDKSYVLIVVPHSDTEVTRSGTWSTYRYAKKIGRKIDLIRRSL